MEVEWDENKRQKILLERGIDLLAAARIFNGRVLTRIDDRRDYGEVRKISLGMADGECYVVVYTERGSGIRLVTAWKGGRDERLQYEKGISRRDRTDEIEG